MRITQEADNAFRVIIYLAQLPKGGKSTARTISEAMNISVQFTLKTLNKLTKSGLTCAFRGVNGGYALNKPAAEISLREVIEVVDGPIAINRCLIDGKNCNRNASGYCEVHNALAGIQDSLTKALDEIRFDTLLEENGPAKAQAEELDA